MSTITLFIYILLTSTVSGALGMAGGVILMAVFLIFLPIPEALILHGITQMSANGFRAYINKEYINKKIIVPYVLSALVAYTIFHFIQFKPSKKMVFIILSLLPFLGILKRTSLHFDIEKKGRAALCGFLVSASQATCGVSGSMLDLFYLSSSLGRFSIVTNKALTQAIGHLLKILYFIQIYNFNFESINQNYYLIAFVTPLFGSIFGKKILKNLSDDSFLILAKITMIGFSSFMFYKGIIS